MHAYFRIEERPSKGGRRRRGRGMRKKGYRAIGETRRELSRLAKHKGLSALGRGLMPGVAVLFLVARSLPTSLVQCAWNKRGTVRTSVRIKPMQSLLVFLQTRTQASV